MRLSALLKQDCRQLSKLKIYALKSTDTQLFERRCIECIDFFCIEFYNQKGIRIMFILKWTNKISRETGFVESISSKERHFINTFDKDKAKRYNSRSVVSRMLTSLALYGEADQNDFEVLEV